MSGSRCDELLARVSEGTRDAIAQFSVDRFGHLVRHSGAPPQSFREKFAKYLVARVERDAWDELERLQLPVKLAEVQDAERRAWDRRARLASAPDTVAAADAPVQLADLTTQQLVDCQLREPRQQWLAELQRRDAEADAQRAALRSALAERTQRMRARIVDVDERLARLRAVHEALA